jgi:hypothetical protein
MDKPFDTRKSHLKAVITVLLLSHYLHTPFILYPFNIVGFETLTGILHRSLINGLEPVQHLYISLYGIFVFMNPSIACIVVVDMVHLGGVVNLKNEYQQ